MPLTYHPCKPRPIVASAVFFSLFAACYLYLTVYDRCCGREFRVLTCSILGAETEWQPAESPATDACYGDKLLAKFGYGASSRENLPPRHLEPGAAPFYFSPTRPIDLSALPEGLLSGGCLAALTGDGVATSGGIGVGHEDATCFQASLSTADLSATYGQLDQLLGNFSARQLEIFISDGSLIGSVRHFGVVPWDDDLDFLIRLDQKRRVRRLLEELSLGPESRFHFEDTEAVNQHWRLDLGCQPGVAGSAKSCRVSLDLFFGRRAGRWFVRDEWPHAFPLGDIYPLSARPFGPGLLVPAPRRPLHFLRRQYRSDVTRQCRYQPHTETPCRRAQLPCGEVRRLRRHPFVRLAVVPADPSGGNATLELLLRGSRLLAAFLPAARDSAAAAGG